MRRYTNWSLIIFGAIFAIIWLVSPSWIPEVQPLLVDDEVQSSFECENYISQSECEVLQQLYEENPDQALAQQDAMNPENDFAVNDPQPSILAEQLRASLNVSDTPEITEVSQGVFSPPRDAIHNARGRVQIFRITTLDTSTERVYLRLDAGGDGVFSVNNGPNLDLHVYLSSDPSPQGGDDFEASAFDVGVLRGNQGQLNFELNPDIDLLQYTSLVIYNPQYDQIFGVADLVRPLEE